MLQPGLQAHDWRSPPSSSPPGSLHRSGTWITSWHGALVRFGSPEGSAWWHGGAGWSDVRRLKVLHLITTLPRLSGAADNTRYTVNLLDPERYDVHLACGPAELDASRVRQHMPVLIVDSLVRTVAPVSDVRALRDLCRMFRKERYDIVHTHNAKAGVLGRIAA